MSSRDRVAGWMSSLCTVFDSSEVIIQCWEIYDSTHTFKKEKYCKQYYCVFIFILLNISNFCI